MTEYDDYDTHREHLCELFERYRNSFEKIPPDVPWFIRRKLIEVRANRLGLGEFLAEYDEIGRRYAEEYAGGYWLEWHESEVDRRREVEEQSLCERYGLESFSDFKKRVGW